MANKADTLIFQVRWILQALSPGSSANTNLNRFIYSKLRIDYACAQRKSYYIAVDWLMTSWRICAHQWPLSVGSFVPTHSNLPVKPIYAVPTPTTRGMISSMISGPWITHLAHSGIPIGWKKLEEYQYIIPACDLGHDVSWALKYQTWTPSPGLSSATFKPPSESIRTKI